MYIYTNIYMYIYNKLLSKALVSAKIPWSIICKNKIIQEFLLLDKTE